MENNNNVYIPSIDAKDLFISNNYNYDNPIGYNLKNKIGEYNLRKFINSLDYSLDLIKLREIYQKKYRRKGFGFYIGRKEYSYQVINVTFKYANKEFNMIRNNVYVKSGYDYNQLEFNDCVSVNSQGELVGIIVGEPVSSPIDSTVLGKYFSYNGECYLCTSSPKVLNSRSDLRTELYKNGFYCNGIHYVRMKRSSGSARVGKCLFVNEDLYKQMHKWELCGLKVKQGQEIDLAGLEAYISLPTSSIIGTLQIEPKNILVIDDYESVFKEDVIATVVENGWLKSEERNVEINNSIWDGQSLLDESLFGEYKDYGMVLLRNRMFKSCCFNTNIQKWFADNNIVSVEQLNGFTLATDIKDVKLITTISSIKYVKFGTIEQWLDNIEPTFGVVKHDKKTHYFDGNLVQTHYQLLNTLQFTKEEMKEFLQPSLDYALQLKNNPAFVRYAIKYPQDKSFDGNDMLTKNDVVFNLMNINNSFTNTKYYNDFTHDLLASFYKNIKCGHVLVNGNYSTLLGNPIEMLQQAIGTFDGTSQIGIGNIHSKRFEYNKLLLGSRSPHVTMGNIWLVMNTANEMIDKYFNLSQEIVCLNSIGENVLQRLSGCDFDSDTVLLTDNQILIEIAKRNYNIFKTPTSLVEAKKTKRYYTPEQQADLDIVTSVNKIGEIINLSQVLNSLYWNEISHGKSHEELHELYCDISTLDVLSCIEIDKAKKEFEIDTAKELNKLRKKYEENLTNDDNGKKILPHFFSHIERNKGYYNKERKDYLKHNTSMDYLQTVINSFRVKNPYKKDYLPFVSILNNSKYDIRRVNFEQIERITNSVREYQTNMKKIYCSDEDCKYELGLIEKERLIDCINCERIGFSTMFQLLTILETDKYKSIKNILLNLLFTTCRESFNNAIIQSIEPIEYVEIGGNDIEVYGIGFQKLQKMTQFVGNPENVI